MKRFSIKFKIVGAIILIVSIFIFVYTFSWYSRFNETLNREFNLQVDTAVTLAAPPLAKALWEFDFRSASNVLDGLRQLPAYRFASVETSGEVFVKESANGLWRPEFDAALSTPDGVPVGGDRRELGDSLIVHTQLTFGGVDVGVLKLGFSKRYFEAERDSMMTMAIGYGVCFTFLIAFVLSSWLSTFIRPIVALAGSVRRISKGDLPDGPLATDRIDEIGALAKAVDLLRESYVQARTDMLTGLPNRRALDDHLAASAASGPYTVLLIDLNDFKPINDHFGHEAGDVVLREIARRLTARAGETARAFRLGGDEFALVATALLDAESAKTLGVEAAEDVRRAIDFKGERLHVSVSVGVAMSTVVAGRPSDVLSAADAAMYAAKQSETALVTVYENSVQHRRYGVRDRRELERALEEGALAPWLQPQVCLSTGRVVGFEALARWSHPERGVLSPGTFMPMIEELQMQRDLDIEMTRRALSFVQERLEAGWKPPSVSVNIAEPTLVRPEGVEQLLWFLEQYPTCQDYLTFEITEDVFVARSAVAIRRALEKLFEAGARISMDDFGTGYGSFRHLQEWDFHELKIDRSFVAKIGKDRASEIIIQSFISMSKGLGAAVVAEGVETEEQVAFLLENGCDLGQGYYFGRPAPMSDTFQWRDEAHAAAALRHATAR